MSNLKVNTINDASGGSAAVLYGVASPPNSMGFRNRIINGDMVIDQRYGGTATANTINGFTLDRWTVNQSVTGKLVVQQSSVVAPVGFSNSLSVTSQSAYSLLSSDYYVITQPIEGFNFADMAWGTANAQTVTLSFRVYSSLTGTFGGALRNGADTRGYPFSYTISAANTWTTVSITIPGDTTGTWIGATNGKALTVNFGLGIGSTYSGTAGAWANGNLLAPTGATSVVGTNGATFYITGVQLEAGTVASPFERRDYGRELMMCQRYFEKSSDDGLSPTANAGQIGWTSVGGNTFPRLRFQFKVPKRATPILTVYDTNGNSGQASTWNNGTITSGAVANVQMNTTEFSVERQDGTVLASRAFIYGAFAASAEL